MWRSWLARTAGGREVAGSNPVIPTMKIDRPQPQEAGASLKTTCE